MWVEIRTKLSNIMKLRVTNLSENSCRFHAHNMKTCDNGKQESLVTMLLFPHVLHSSYLISFVFNAKREQKPEFQRQIRCYHSTLRSNFFIL